MMILAFAIIFGLPLGAVACCIAAWRAAGPDWVPPDSDEVRLARMDATLASLRETRESLAASHRELAESVRRLKASNLSSAAAVERMEARVEHMRKARRGGGQA